MVKRIKEKGGSRGRKGGPGGGGGGGGGGAEREERGRDTVTPPMVHGGSEMVVTV